MGPAHSVCSQLTGDRTSPQSQGPFPRSWRGSRGLGGEGGVSAEDSWICVTLPQSSLLQKTKMAQGGMGQAGLLDSFKPEIQSTNQSSLHTSTARPERGMCNPPLTKSSRPPLHCPGSQYCTPNWASQPKGNGTKGIRHNNCRTCKGTAAHFVVMTNPLK